MVYGYEGFLSGLRNLFTVETGNWASQVSTIEYFVLRHFPHYRALS